MVSVLAALVAVTALSAWWMLKNRTKFSNKTHPDVNEAGSSTQKITTTLQNLTGLNFLESTSETLFTFDATNSRNIRAARGPTVADILTQIGILSHWRTRFFFPNIHGHLTVQHRAGSIIQLNMEGLSVLRPSGLAPSYHSVENYITKHNSCNFVRANTNANEQGLTITDAHPQTGLSINSSAKFDENGFVVKITSEVSGLKTSLSSREQARAMMNQRIFICMMIAATTVVAGLILIFVENVFKSGDWITSLGFGFLTFLGIAAGVPSGYRTDRINAPDLELLPQSWAAYLKQMAPYSLIVGVIATFVTYIGTALATLTDVTFTTAPTQALLGLAAGACIIVASTLLWTAVSTKGKGKQDEVNGEQLKASGFTVALANSISTQSAFLEESLFRIVGVFLVLYLTDSALLAILLPAIIWTGIHNWRELQPTWLRATELIIQGIIFGALSITWGPITAVAAHFTYNFILMAGPLFYSSRKQSTNA